MNFIQFCQSYGILIRDYPPIGAWTRYPTEDKPRSRNGAVKFMGDVGFAQNHATMPDVVVWRPDKHDEYKIDHAEVARKIKAHEAKVAAGRRRAAQEAHDLIRRCRTDSPAYLARKGFPNELALMDGDVLVIPMRINNAIAGAQLIDFDGGKKFIFGQATSEACYIIGDPRERPIFCEGYATGLSIRDALKACKMKACVVVCFSAFNVPRMASIMPGGVVVADNDESGTGERSAVQAGVPYWMPPTAGQDANDFHRKNGIFKLSMELKRLLMLK